MTQLSTQQRGFLAEAAKHEWVSANTFVGASKPSGGNYTRRTITVNSAYKVLARLRERGLVGNAHQNPALFSITEAGRQALERTRGPWVREHPPTFGPFDRSGGAA